ncbi:PREDICTED: glutamate receptor 2.9-like isoform X1 [Nelumbo nucifera]|uniref:Glutamate receptor 2.9-like isoform X1 n=1 Tax=Nelumbo nucifera TaxID=4432 RepID=A0A1U7Z4K7_NELNU|nr:PREDICTED: glutamate receptor 2.9-like isoform X1 [Nelumbo nucifera]
MKNPSYLIFLLLCSSLSFYPNTAWAKGSNVVNVTSLFHVGVVFDLNSLIGSAVWRRIEMALSDCYAFHPSHDSRIILHLRDRKGDTCSNAVSVAVDLIEDVKVQGIIGPEDFLVAMGNKVEKLGMMKLGYLWIATSIGLTDLMVHKDTSFFRSSEGVVGMKSQQRTQVQKEEIDLEKMKLNIYATLWANNTLFVMANAVDRGDYDSRKNIWSTMDSSKMHVTKFKIVNWTKSTSYKARYSSPRSVISRSLRSEDATKNHVNNFPATFRKGATVSPSDDKILKIAVPCNTSFAEFVNVTCKENGSVTGFSIEVFDAVMQKLSYRYKYVPFEFGNSYNTMIDQVFNKAYDAAVGDITIRANRSKFVGFTQPYAGSGVRMIVPVEHESDTNGLWWFLKPFTAQLWLTTLVFFLLKGVLVWIFEHQQNPEFQGSKYQQLGKVLYFSFSLLVFAQKENLQTNYSRFVTYLWMFSLFIIVASYNANLTSILTVDNLRPTVTSLDTLLKEGSYVGYQKGSYVGDLLKEKGFSVEKLKMLSTTTEYAQALSNKSVAAIVDDIPVINVFLKKYCNQFTIAGPTIQTGGFGFVFPKNSPMIPIVSEQILVVRENQEMDKIENKYFGHETCLEPSTNVTSIRLRLYSLRSIYLITGVGSASALFVFFISSILFSHKVEALEGKEQEQDGLPQVTVLQDGNTREVSIKWSCHCPNRRNIRNMPLTTLEENVV